MKLNNPGASKAVLEGVDFGAAAEADFNAACDLALADLIGTVATVAARGAVTGTDLLMAYIKQLVTELQALDAVADLTLVDTTAIVAVTNALRVLTETGGTLTGTNAEQDLYINDAPDGIFIPCGIYVDFDLMAADDIAEVRIKYRIKSGGDMQPFEYYALTAADGGLANGLKGVYYPLTYNRYGVEVTLVQTQATTSYKDFDWEVFYLV